MTDNHSENPDKEKFTSIGTADEEALAWFTRLSDEHVESSVRLEFLNWRQAKPENKQAYDRIAAFWHSEVFEKALQKDEARLMQPSKKHRMAPSLAMAATLLLAVWGVWQSSLLQRLRSDIYTPVGKQRTLTLADGSSVMLDTDSAIIVSFSERTRNVTLLNGRAFFNVEPDSSRPFIIKTDRERIRVVGTRFSVQRDSNAPLTVQQGIVSYRMHGEDNDTIVTAGEQLRKSNSQVDVITIDPQAPVFAWLEGRLKFNDRPLAEVIAEVDRYQPGVIVIGKSALANLHVSGNYKLHNPRSIITALAQAAGARVAHISDYLTILY